MIISFASASSAFPSPVRVADLRRDLLQRVNDGVASQINRLVAMPSRSNCRVSARSGRKCKSASWPVRRRLISSGKGIEFVIGAQPRLDVAESDLLIGRRQRRRQNRRGVALRQHDDRAELLADRLQALRARVVTCVSVCPCCMMSRS